MREQEVRRCAVYTRKSCEDGLELDYNSLEAQYDAAASYIRSQAANGWELIPKRYDDGGFSGGDLDLVPIHGEDIQAQHESSPENKEVV